MRRFLVVWMLLCITGCATAPPAAPNPTPITIPTTPLELQTPVLTPTIPLTPRPTASPTHRPTLAPTALPTTVPTVVPTQVPTQATADPLLIGAGDIAYCEATGDEATAAIIEKIPGIVFTLGDNVYLNGTLQQFQDCYAPSWGKFKERTHPIPGNHDYNTGGAKGYFAYFGAAAGEPGKGYYSYDVGTWHIVALNSEIETGENSPQVGWLRDDLASHPAKCTAALFHRPLFSSGPHGRDGSGDKTRPLWDVLYENNVDVVLNGHDHDYERFAPQNPQGVKDEARGIRQFVVGTGGATPYGFGEPKPNSEKRISGPFGVLKLTLHSTGYDWEFISIAPLLFNDSGQRACH